MLSYIADGVIFSSSCSFNKVPILFVFLLCVILELIIMYVRFFFFSFECVIHVFCSCNKILFLDLDFVEKIDIVTILGFVNTCTCSIPLGRSCQR